MIETIGFAAYTIVVAAFSYLCGYGSGLQKRISFWKPMTEEEKQKLEGRRQNTETSPSVADPLLAMKDSTRNGGGGWQG
jgi:hypothetical protein